MLYTTVFSVADSGPGAYAFAGVGVAVAAAGVMAWSFSRGGRDPKLARLGAATSVIGVLWVVLGVTITASHTASLKQALESGTAHVTEGRVEDFRPMRGGCHGDESFRVGRERFSYRDCVVTGAFNHTGGPIYPNEQVRITHVGNAILKLEVASGGRP